MSEKEFKSVRFFKGKVSKTGSRLCVTRKNYEPQYLEVSDEVYNKISTGDNISWKMVDGKIEWLHLKLI
jgi:hypothetical protein